ncbi:hypothetical protein RsTz2092_02210 [Deferribacterales bacterium RsTz2092]|nr:hypothetical protein AGMMS49941_13490 [Deferribacterales bacterium]
MVSLQVLKFHCLAIPAYLGYNQPIIRGVWRMQYRQFDKTGERV